MIDLGTESHENKHLYSNHTHIEVNKTDPQVNQILVYFNFRKLFDRIHHDGPKLKR